MKKLCLIFLLICLLATAGCGHEHTWINADCLNPVTCSDCGQTAGEALGHRWKDATCTSPQVCDVCHQTNGTVLDHQWNSATCSAPQTCSLCGQTEGTIADHVFKPDDFAQTLNGWSVIKESDGHFLLSQTCFLCNEVVSSHEVDITDLGSSENIENGAFIFTAHTFAEWLHMELGPITSGLLGVNSADIYYITVPPASADLDMADITHTFPYIQFRSNASDKPVTFEQAGTELCTEIALIIKNQDVYPELCNALVVKAISGTAMISEAEALCITNELFNALNSNLSSRVGISLDSNITITSSIRDNELLFVIYANYPN